MIAIFSVILALFLFIVGELFRGLRYFPLLIVICAVVWILDLLGLLPKDSHTCVVEPLNLTGGIVESRSDSRLSCVAYIPSGQWKKIDGPDSYWNCKSLRSAPNGFEYEGHIDQVSVVDKPGFWKTTYKKETVCVLVLPAGRWIKKED